ncbi:hypothetical protein J7T55_006131 [Diaporthe amygdali]|uniref:uncharacterized protein n=1 Tax=Phomopsis amygdali TaxID=1214568 RepID=UPI0022FE29FC|nr:uncharacterized protein J7T55_006131 [Diaporthe amygdali]KAJ0124790.1 hypothetical protein J7T55_006131 [Diaporthe amygdali]
MGLNSGSKAIITAMRAAQPYTGLKRLTVEVNDLLPPKMKVEKHELRDFVRILDNPSNTPVTITRPRDESFPANIVNQAFSVYRDAERQFLLDLEHDTVRNLYPQGPEPKCHAVAHLRHHVELLLTLKGMKPCVPFVSPKPTGIATMDSMVLRCLVPLMEQFDLESYGFKLYYIATNIRTTTQQFRGFKGSWVFADLRSVAWPLVRDIFVTPRDPVHRLPESLLCRAMGMPVHNDRLINRVVIKDHTEYELLQSAFDQDTCQVGVVDIFCDDGNKEDWLVIIRYFKRCQLVALELGTALIIDVGEHPMMEQWLAMEVRRAT